MADSALDQLRVQIDGIEESYEFMLAYAAQGLTSDTGSKSGSQLRVFLEKAITALDTLADLFVAVVEERGLQPREQYDAFVDVLREDTRKASAAVRMTMLQPNISSQLIDNLNASIHLRAVLTDVFLLDEVISPRSTAGAAG